MKRILLRASALLLTLLLLAASLASCASTVRAKTVVGEVDGVEIYYDELYFLVQSYLEPMRAKHQDNPEALANALHSLVEKDIVANAAILRLCEKRGLTYGTKELRDEVDLELETLINESFGGDKDAYAADRVANGLTERYLRYTLGLDLLYGELMTVYPAQKLVKTNQRDLTHYIESHFYHVYHLVLFNDTEEEASANLAKMQEAREQLLSWESTMYGLIKDGYTEDFSDPDGSGYYIHRGTMDEKYETAAFSLEVGQVSEIVETTAVNNQGKTVSCYYLIQRFALDYDYIESHLGELQDEYYSAVIYNDLTDVRKSISFTPNDFYESLDLNALKAPRETSVALVITLSAVGAALLIGAGVTVTVLLLKKKYKQKNLTH